MANKYIAMGDNGKYSVSTDGVNWTTYNNNATVERWGTVGDITSSGDYIPINWAHTGVYDYVNNIYLAIAKPVGQNLIRLYRSADGINWFDSNIASPTALALSPGIGYASGISLFGSQSGRTFASYTGFSGEDFTTALSTSSLTLRLISAFAGGNSIFFGLGDRLHSNYVFNWTVPAPNEPTRGTVLRTLTTNVFGQATALAYSQSISHLVGFSNGRAKVSTDLGVSIAHDNQVLDMVRSYTIFRGKTHFYAAGAAYVDPLDPAQGFENRLAISADGITWSSVATPVTTDKIYHFRPADNGGYMVAGSNGYYAYAFTPSSTPIWNEYDLGFDSGDNVRVFFSSYPVIEDDEYLTVGADVPVYTVDQETLIQATLRYEAPVQTGQDNLILYKVAKDYRWSKTGEVFPAMPQTDEGRPFYENIFDPDDPTQTTFTTQPGILPYRYEIVEPWGKIAIFINGQDVSYFRDAATVIESISWQTLGNFESASFYLPQISQYDKLGETIPTLTSGTGGGILPNAIEWLTDDAPIEIKRIRPDDTLETIWLGTVNGLDLDPSGMGMRITAHGLLYEANHQLLPGQFQQPKFIPSRDTGLLAAEVLNSIDGRWSYTQPEETGVLTKKSPNWDNALDFLRNLNAIGSPEIWIDTDYKAYVTGRPDLSNDRRASTFDIINGQDGVECSLQYDSNAAPTVIYGTGRTPGGARWRNVVYPAVENLIFYARYPFDFPEQHLSKGMSNTDTVGGFGVSGLWARLSVKGFLPSTVGFTTYFNDTIEAAVKIAQETYGLDINGEVDDVLWSRLFDVADIFDGAYIAPLYTSPLIDPSSPSFDPTVRRVEQFIDFGENMFPSEAIDVAEKIIERDMIQYNTTGTPIYKQRKSVTGTIAMSMDPIEYVLGGDVSRWDLKPGDSIRLLPHIFAPIQDDKHDAESGTFWESGDSGGSLLLYIKRIEWSFGDTPKAILTVSTRNLEFNELDAAQARVKVSNAERAIDQKAKKASGKTASS